MWLFNKIFRKEKKSFIRKMGKTSETPHKIRDWQLREQNLSNVYLNKQISFPLFRIRMLHKNALKNFSFTHDSNGDYWATSSEVLDNVNNNGKLNDDCDGFAVYMWHLLRLIGFSSVEVGMCLVEGHMFCAYHPKNMKDDFYVIDNGYLVPKRVVKKANDVFPAIVKDKYGEEITVNPLVEFGEYWWATY